MARSVLLVLLLASPALAQPRASSPDGKLFATAKDKAITVSTGQPGRIVMQILAHTDEVTALAYGPDGKLLVSADKGGAVRLFDAATGKQLRSLAGPKGVTSVEVSADGKTLTVKADKETKKFDMATGAEVK